MRGDDPSHVNLLFQIDRQLEGFSYFLPISSTAVYGGTDVAGYAQQRRAR